MKHRSEPTHVPDQVDDVVSWLELYQLAFNPFSLPIIDAAVPVVGDAGSSLFYGGGQRQALVDELAHNSRFSSGVTVLSGPAAIGKTTLCRRLTPLLGHDVSLTVVSAALYHEVEPFFHAIARGFQFEGADSAKPGEVIAAIRHQLQDSNALPAVLVIDDAHLLEDHVLGALLSILVGADASPNTLHMVLSGDDVLIRRLDLIAAVDVLLQDCPLPALSKEESREYINYKWRAATPVELPLSDDILRQVVAQARGLPGQIDSFVEVALQESALKHDKVSGLPVAHMIMIVALVSFLLISYLYKDGWIADDTAEPTTEQKVTMTEQPLRPADESNELTDKDSRIEEESLQANQDPVVVTAAEPILLPANQSIEGQPNEQKAVAGPGSTVKAESPVNSKAEDDLQSVLAEEAKALDQVVQPSTVLQDKHNNGAQVDGLDQSFLLSQPGDYFVIQVMAASSRSAVSEFISVQKNEEALNMFETTRLGKPWYVVVTETYSTRVQAERAISQLPENQQQAGPWLRRLDGVQQEIMKLHNQ